MNPQQFILLAHLNIYKFPFMRVIAPRWHFHEKYSVKMCFRWVLMNRISHNVTFTSYQNKTCYRKKWYFVGMREFDGLCVVINHLSYVSKEIKVPVTEGTTTLYFSCNQYCKSDNTHICRQLLWKCLGMKSGTADLWLFIIMITITIHYPI